MKVALVNGSPHRRGCTARALDEVARALEACDVEPLRFWIGRRGAGGCMACNSCVKTGVCVLDDAVNEFRPMAAEADGFVFGAPVHYAHAGANLLGFMDRLFYSDGRGGERYSSALALKPAAAVVCARRSGTTVAFDDINKYFTIAQMPIVSSCYWNMVHGDEAPEVEQDEEGLHIMRQLGRNMAWLLRCIEAGASAGVEPPRQDPVVWTSFVRPN